MLIIHLTPLFDDFYTQSLDGLQIATFYFRACAFILCEKVMGMGNLCPLHGSYCR